MTEICGTVPRERDAARGRSRAVAGERGEALLQARAAGVDEADDRRAARAGQPQHADDRVGVRLAERAAEEGRVLRVSRRPAGRRPRRRRRRRRRRRAPARPCGASATPVRSELEACPGRRAPRRRSQRRRARLVGRGGRRGQRSALMRPPGTRHGVVAAEAERVGDRDRRAVAVARAVAGLVGT